MVPPLIVVIPAKAGTQGGQTLRVRPSAPACAGGDGIEELGIICLLRATRGSVEIKYTATRTMSAKAGIATGTNLEYRASPIARGCGDSERASAI
jgi:hypothetical protein